LSPADWVAHYGLLWLPFFLQKLRFDPRRTLASGQGSFDDLDSPWGRLACQ
jgi:cytokinin dehydrogenase 1-like protein